MGELDRNPKAAEKHKRPNALTSQQTDHEQNPQGLSGRRFMATAIAAWLRCDTDHRLPRRRRLTLVDVGDARSTVTCGVRTASYLKQAC
jgi:hypothetical protein